MFYNFVKYSSSKTHIRNVADFGIHLAELICLTVKQIKNTSGQRVNLISDTSQGLCRILFRLGENDSCFLQRFLLVVAFIRIIYRYILAFAVVGDLGEIFVAVLKRFLPTWNVLLENCSNVCVRFRHVWLALLLLFPSFARGGVHKFWCGYDDYMPMTAGTTEYNT